MADSKYNPILPGGLAVAAPNLVPTTPGDPANPGAGLVRPKVEIPAAEKPIVNANGLFTQNAGVETLPAANRSAQFMAGTMDNIGFNKGNPGSVVDQTPAVNTPAAAPYDSAGINKLIAESKSNIADHHQSLNELKAKDAAAAAIPKTEWNGVDPFKPPSFLGGNGGASIAFSGGAVPKPTYMEDIKSGIGLQKDYFKNIYDQGVSRIMGAGNAADRSAQIYAFEAAMGAAGKNDFANNAADGGAKAHTDYTSARNTDVHEQNANARSAAQDAISARNADLAHGESAMGMDKYQTSLARKAAAGDVKAGVELRDLVQMFHGSVDANNTVDDMGAQHSNPIYRTGPYTGLNVGAEKYLPTRSK